MDTLLLMQKEVDVKASPVLYDRPFSAAALAEDWQVRGGDWTVRDGWLTGRNPENAPGMVTSRGSFPGNVFLEFEAQTILPSTHDIDCMWNGSWDEAANERGTAYVAGIQGWWEGKIGIEKSPDYALNAATPLFPFEPGRVYTVRAGSIDGHCFVFVDGRLMLEVTDPNPIDNRRCAMIGFEAYASHIRIRNLIVRQACWKKRTLAYPPEF